MAVRRRPVLRYFGGKWRIADWIVSLLPEHRVYVEPFCGAASVLFKKPRSYAEVINDIDDSVFNLFRVLQNREQMKQLEMILKMTPFARREFELAHSYHPDPVENAKRLIVRSFMGFGADSVTNIESKTGFRSNSNRSGTTPAHDWLNYPQQIPLFFERLQGVVIENLDAFQLIRQHDGSNTLFYIDPPYHTDTRRSGRYKFEFSDNMHRELIDVMKGLDGICVVSGYDHPLYDSLGWTKHTKEARADKAGKRIECIWINR